MVGRGNNGVIAELVYISFRLDFEEVIFYH